MATSPELLLISAILKKQDHLTAAARGVTPDMFHAYPEEYEWLEDYVNRYSRVPSITTFRGKFPEFVPKKVDDVEHFCEEVRENHARICMQKGLNEIVQDLRSGDIRKALLNLHSVGITVESQYLGSSGDSDVFTNWQDTYEEVQRRADRVKNFGIAGIPTGFPTIDEELGGFQPGWLVVVAARLGNGKTWALVRMSVAAAFSGLSVQYDALEQSRAEIAMRVHTFASSEYGREIYRNTDLVQGRNFSSADYKKFLQDMRNKVQGKFHIADATRGAVSTMTLASQIERNQPDALYIDYLTLMNNGDFDDYRGAAKLSAGLKQLAGRYRLPIIAAAQLNRSAANGRDLHGADTLAESDSIGRDADVVLTMRQLSKRVLAMRVAKNRHGNGGQILYISFDPNIGKLEEITFDEAQDLKMEDKDREDNSSSRKQFKHRQRGSFAETAKQRQAGGSLIKKSTIKTITVRRSSSS
jgi:replicative DNA helicase